MKTKKVPMRKCVICGKSIDKRQLLRIVLNADGEVEIDKTGRKNGRGAYFCHDAMCKKDDKSIEKIFRVLKTDVSKEKIAEIKNYYDEYENVEVLKNED